MSKCPFNASHVIPDEKYRNHIEICPDKAWLECQRGIATNSNTNFSPSTDYESSFPKPTSDGANIFCNEDWDQETFASSSANKSLQVKNRCCISTSYNNVVTRKINTSVFLSEIQLVKISKDKC